MKILKKIIRFPILLTVFTIKYLIKLLELYISFISFTFKKNHRFKIGLGQDLCEIFDDLKRKVIHKSNTAMDIPLVFYTPNAICDYRADSFSSKEPEILNWIDENGGDEPFWDIGACIGLYSIYYAKCHTGRVVAFEPSFFNLKQIAKNIYINNTHHQIDIVPSPLSNSQGFSKFAVSGTEEGGATNAFGVDYGGDGKKIHKEFEYSVMGITADSFLAENKDQSVPKLIKIDVDGIEHLILKGMINILSSPKCRSVYVEVMDSFVEQASGVEKILRDCGFYLEKKYEHSSTNNQIWFKN